MKHLCIICNEKFDLSRAEINMIRNKEVKTTDIVICDQCADMAFQLAEVEEWGYNSYMNNNHELN
jgi:hypothetical protein